MRFAALALLGCAKVAPAQVPSAAPAPPDASRAIDAVVDAAGVDASMTDGGPRRGSLDKEVIRSIIRTHIDQIKRCYEDAAAVKNDLEGRVVVQFTIAATGQVVSASIANSTVHFEKVEKCICDAARTWTFPKPSGGGIVIVSYPFVLEFARYDGGTQ